MSVLSHICGMKFRYIILICLIFGQKTVLFSQPESRSKVLRTELYRFDCMIRKDTIALRSLLADDLVYVHSNALIETKNEHIGAISKGKLVYQHMDRKEVTLRKRGKFAITNGIINVRGILNGTPFEVRLQYSATYRRKSLKWRLINWQSTRIP